MKCDNALLGEKGDSMKNIKNDIVEVIRACDVAFLSTINLNNFPETRALINVLNREIDDKLEIYFVSDINAPKVEQLKKNSDASLYYYVAANMKNMILFGKLEVVTDKSLKDKLWQDSFLEYYEKGKDDEQYGVLKFIPTGYKYYTYEAGDYRKNEGKF
jgi:general stress protein 26